MKSTIVILFTLILISCKTPYKAEKKIHYNIETTDVRNFWNAFDKLNSKEDSVLLMQNEFLSKATSDFSSFLDLRPNITPENLVHSLTHYPNFWKTIRPLTLKCFDIKPEIDDMYNRFSKLYPNFQPPNICFGITPISTGGTVDKKLILIGTEIASVNPSIVDIHEINSFYKEIFKNSNGDLLKTVTHEAVHTQQKLDSLDQENLLAMAIIEGGADFVAEKVLQEKTINKAIFKYGENNENELWLEFTENVNANLKTSNTNWLYNYQSERPADLGYYIGYKICESYYNQSNNKKKALSEIINVDDFEEFLIKSKYKGIGR